MNIFLLSLYLCWGMVALGDILSSQEELCSIPEEKMLKIIECIVDRGPDIFKKATGILYKCVDERFENDGKASSILLYACRDDVHDSENINNCLAEGLITLEKRTEEEHQELKEVSKYCFQSVITTSEISSGHTDIVYPTVETLSSGEKRIKFSYHGQDVDLILQPAGDVIADDFAVTHKENSKQNEVVNVNDLKRKLFRNGESGAALIIDEDGPLTIKGIISFDLKIEPDQSIETMKDGRKAHNIKRISYDKSRKFVDRVIPQRVRKSSENSLRNLTDDECVEIEYFFAIESNVTKSLNTTEIEEFLSLMLNALQNIMDTMKMPIKVKMIGMVEYTMETEPNYIKQGGIPGQEFVLWAGQIMGPMADHFCKQDDPLVKRADIITLVSKRLLGYPEDDGTFFYRIAGMAFVGGACHPCNKVTMVRYFDNDPVYVATFLAHESAHAFGVPHDGVGDCPFSDYFMGGHKVYPGIFSPCSIMTFKKFLNNPVSSCVIKNCTIEEENEL